MKRLAVLTALIVSGVSGTSTAEAHLVRPFPKHQTPQLRKKIVKENLAHVSYVCAHTTYITLKRAHCQGTRWLRRELDKVQARLQPIQSSMGGMASGTATWYGPGFYWNTAACGPTYTPGAMWAASMTHGCGTPVTICNVRCVRTTIQDTGAFSVTFDLTAALAKAIGCLCTQSVRYRYG